MFTEYIHVFTALPLIFFCRYLGTRLHLKFPDYAGRTLLTQNMPQFIQLARYIDGLYFEKIGINDTLARTLITFDNLKVLQVSFSMGAPILANIPTL